MHDLLTYGVPAIAVILAAFLTRKTAKDTNVVVEAKGSVEAFMKIIQQERRDRVSCEKELEEVRRRLVTLERIAEGPNTEADRRGSGEEQIGS